MLEPEPAQVRELFGRLAPAYDRFNALASGGLDRWWRFRAVRPLAPGWRVLDVGCGTGDLTLAARRRVGPAGTVVGTDFVPEMLGAARAKAARRGAAGVEFVAGAADALPFPDASFDAVVSAFVLRSLARVRVAAAREAARVLKPGGVACLLELTRPRVPGLRALHRAFVAGAIPLIGRAAAGSAWPSGYLEGTVLGFPEPEAYAGWFISEGFTCERITRLTGGIASLLVLRRA